jgi:cysteine-rich repeat protein
MMKYLPVLALVLIVACNGSGVVTTDGDTTTDVATEDTPAGRTDIAADLGELDAAPELIPQDLAAVDSEPACEPGTGCFGDPCGDGSACLSGLCVPHMGDTVCTIECLEDCPDGWGCQALNSGPDMIFACLSPYAHLCRPCATQADCATGAIEDACIDYGAEGSYCGAGCAGGGLCPVGYSCVDAKTTAGVGLKQCVSDSGICACSPLSVKLGLATPCALTNDFGSCPGLRACTEEGLAPCDAMAPEEEICDGADNDCDGVTDDVACDDGNDCTADACDADTGCTHETLTGTSCDDGDVCTLADHCELGVCAGTTINCDDSNLCTTDACDPTGGCIYTFNTADCDDGDPCTVADECKQGACGGFAIDCDCDTDTDCLALEDGDICNGTLVCDTAVLPHECVVDPGTIIECPEPEGVDAPCLEAACHPLSGECSFAPAGDGATCEDGNLCTLGDQCLDGACVPGAPISTCNDGNPCTADSCDPVNGCLFVADDDGTCDDANPCTTGDHCAAGVCVFDAGLDCADDNVCTTDTCDPTSGCVQLFNTGPCDDGDLCTTGDHCAAGVCVAAGAFSCDDGNPCTDDSCDPVQGCLHAAAAVAAACDDGNPCTIGDHCEGGLCVAAGTPDCSDGNLCTDDLCNPAQGCLNVANTVPCDDGDACTTSDLCADGTCAGGPAPNCDDGNPCTDDACLPASGCAHTDNLALCDDQNACTQLDVCASGDCLGTEPLDCDDDNVCTTDSCDPATGCVHALNTAPCDDGDPCTTGDHCDLGACVSSGGFSCDDGNPCTDDACDAVDGCVHTPADGGAACDDGNPCTTGDHCDAGLCVAAGIPDCDDDDVCTTDLCNPASGGCIHVLNQSPCDDGDICTLGDHCHLGDCQGGAALTCDDGNPCTDDACAPQSGCTFTPNALPCNDGDPCTLADVCALGDCVGTTPDACDDDNLCTDDACVPGVGCANVPNTVPCNDGDSCTLVDVCVDGACVGTTPPNCEDSNPCTDDSCAPDTGCVHTDNSNPCNDSNACTQVDTCVDGACVGADPLTCDDLDDCTADSCEPATGCVYDPISPCCGNGVTEPPEQCDDGNDVDGDGCSNACVAPWVAFNQYSSAGRTVYIFKSNPSAALSTYTSFCEGKGLAWFTPKNQSDAQTLINNAYALDSYHTWIITKNTTTAGTFGGYSVTVDSASCVAYSSSGFSAIRKWACSYCDPENHGVTRCWDGDHQYDWLVCEGS